MLPAFLFCLLVVMCLTGLVAMFSVRRELRKEHPEVCERLFGSSLRIAKDMKFSVFLLSGSYAKSVDVPLKKKMDTLRLFTFAYLTVFVATVVVFGWS
ncbi:MAG TPA: hypothetical protein PK322_09035 [Opitutaceae bacterium]|nr:hypothetical protein [Opitutaceae bacterium]